MFKIFKNLFGKSEEKVVDEGPIDAKTIKLVQESFELVSRSPQQLLKFFTTNCSN